MNLEASGNKNLTSGLPISIEKFSPLCFRNKATIWYQGVVKGNLDPFDGYRFEEHAVPMQVTLNAGEATLLIERKRTRRRKRNVCYSISVGKSVRLVLIVALHPSLVVCWFISIPDRNGYLFVTHHYGDTGGTRATDHLLYKRRETKRWPHEMPFWLFKCC